MGDGARHGDVTYPTDPDAYELLAEVGQGATAVVYLARCKPLDKEVAVKIIDLDATTIGIEQFKREIAIMSRSAHSNVLRLYASFIKNKTIWLILEFHPYGSIADVIKRVWPDGFREQNERFISAVLFQSLHALTYFHEDGQMHRDVKASNLLLAAGGEVRMADFGVSSEAPSCRRSMTRLTFVGTPCWMAPEVLTLKGYKKSADIWSIGITALELAFGQPPHAQYPPMKVMALTLKAQPPTVDHFGQNSFSQPFRNFVDLCLRKDPSRRPTASELLKHPLFAPFQSSETAASECVAHVLSQWDIPRLTRNPVRKDSPSEEPVDSSPRRGEPPVDDWDFPADTPTDEPPVDPDLPQWRQELNRLHRATLAEYSKVAALQKFVDLTISSAKNVKTGLPFTLHELDVGREGYSEQVLKEDVVTCVLGMQHPGIVACQEVWEDGINSVWWITEARPGGTLSQYIRQAGPFSDEVTLAVVRNLAQVVEFAHSQGLVLKRLSSMTVVVSVEDGILTPKIDLASIMLIPKAIKHPDSQAEAYMPREQFEVGYDGMVDIYALGMIMLEMRTGKYPYAELRNPYKLVQAKLKGTPPAALSSMPPECKDLQELISQLSDPQPSRRPDAATLLQNPIFRGLPATPGIRLSSGSAQVVAAAPPAS
eukprot:TRINITY_DN47180_c0_g1_i1.p1 TRINITY_DN47180_c0_g1~~TRINITY_DN47180_c0_g1_i1.p1  ORF type:complete len:689 (+),score=194.04 TRINITY_DN47180_c0_g1_i1:108-2069(+)